MLKRVRNQLVRQMTFSKGGHSNISFPVYASRIVTLPHLEVKLVTSCELGGPLWLTSKYGTSDLKSLLRLNHEVPCTYFIVLKLDHYVVRKLSTRERGTETAGLSHCQSWCKWILQPQVKQPWMTRGTASELHQTPTKWLLFWKLLGFEAACYTSTDNQDC